MLINMISMPQIHRGKVGKIKYRRLTGKKFNCITVKLKALNFIYLHCLTNELVAYNLEKAIEQFERNKLLQYTDKPKKH